MVYKVVDTYRYLVVCLLFFDQPQVTLLNVSPHGHMDAYQEALDLDLWKLCPTTVSST